MGTLIPLIVLTIVFILIAVRRIGSVDLRIWQVMLIGAVVVVLTGWNPMCDVFAGGGEL